MHRWRRKKNGLCRRSEQDPMHFRVQGNVQLRRSLCYVCIAKLPVHKIKLVNRLATLINVRRTHTRTLKWQSFMSDSIFSRFLLFLSLFVTFVFNSIANTFASVISHSYWMVCNMLSRGPRGTENENDGMFDAQLLYRAANVTPNAMTSMDFSRAQSTGRNRFVSSHRIRPPHQHETPFNLFIAPRIVYEALYAVTVVVVDAVAGKIQIPFPSLLERARRACFLCFCFDQLFTFIFCMEKKYNQNRNAAVHRPLASQLPFLLLTSEARHF